METPIETRLLGKCSLPSLFFFVFLHYGDITPDHLEKKKKDAPVPSVTQEALSKYGEVGR